MATTAPLPSELARQPPGPRLEDCGDETLASLVAEADEAAFAVLFERHYQALYRYCRSIVHDDPDAQDALQTAWTGALVALRQGRRDAPVRPWLYRIVHNEAISVLRRRRHSPEPADAAPRRTPSAEDHAIDRERFALLVADLRQLPERPRGALLMRELNGLSHEEIAAVLDTSVAAAKQCVYEARRHLAELAAGRQTPCDEICRSISDGDRRVLRGRKVLAHLRDCPGCAAFASTIDERRAALHALTPWLAAPAAITVLDRVLRAGSGAASATTTAAGAAGSMAAAGTAGPAAVAGGVITKALGVSLASKAVIAIAAVASLGGVGVVWHGVGRPAAAPQAPTRFSHPAAGTRNPVVTPPGPAARGAGSSSAATAGASGATGPSRSTRVPVATSASTTAQPGRRLAVGHTAGAVPPGQAKKGVKATGAGATHAQTPARAHGNGVAAGSSHATSAGSSHRSAGSDGHRVHVSASHSAVAHRTVRHGAVAHGSSPHASRPPRPHGDGSPSGHSTTTGKPASSAASAASPASATPPAITPAGSTVPSSGKSGDVRSK